MWLYILVFLYQSSFGASLQDDCYLRDRWDPQRVIFHKRFHEIYRPMNESEPSLAYLLWGNMAHSPPYVSIDRVEYQPGGSCVDRNVAKYHAMNMSLISMDRSACTFHFDWPKVLIYFNKNLTLGILTECSMLKKIRHVLYDGQPDLLLGTPTKTEIQNLVMHYEGDTIDLNNTSLGIVSLKYENHTNVDCLCTNESRFTRQADVVDPSPYFDYRCLVLFALFLVIISFILFL